MQIYWTKGLYYNGKLFKNDWTLKNLITELDGFGRCSFWIFIKKLEASHHRFDPTLVAYRNSSIKNKILNTELSFITNTVSNRNELWRYQLIRLYLIKTFRGRAQSLGKPSRGQRTWSNAWTAFNQNTLLRSFINEVNKHRKKRSDTVKKKNYKLIARKLKKKIFKVRQITKTNFVNSWF
jgi:ribosomal protein S13